MAKNWMKGAVKPSHKGLFARKAKAAGMSTSAYAAKERHSKNPTLKREAVLAQTFAKFRPKGKRGSVKERLARHTASGAFGRKGRAA